MAGRLHTRGWLSRAPRKLVMLPLGLQWVWLGWRYRAWMLPTAVNPFITTGGLVGESKQEYWAISGRTARQYWAPMTVLPAGQHQQWQTLMQQHGLDWPLMVKPARGLCGYGVQKVEQAGQMQVYLAAYPESEDLILQPFSELPGEAGLFYWRHPAQKQGQLTGIALRQPPAVTGDGRLTLAQLIDQAGLKAKLRTAAHDSALDWQTVPAAGQLVRLAVIGSSRVGGVYCDGQQYHTPALEAAVRRVADDMTAFHFGRLDVRFADPAALQRGEFTIIEINGAGSEAIQAWDATWTLSRALRTVFAKQAMAFAIGDALRQQGHAPASLWQVWKLNRKQQRLLDQYPPSN